MNKSRRKELARLVEEIDKLISDLEMIKSDEESYLESIPENLQLSDNAMNSEAAIEALDSAVTALEEASGSIEEAI